MLLLASLVKLATLTAGGASLADAPLAYTCRIETRATTPRAVAGTYPTTTDPGNLTAVMQALHHQLRPAYPESGADTKVHCEYRDRHGKGRYGLIYYLADDGLPYGEHIP